MIRGSISTDDYRFGPAVNSFIKLVTKANLNYEVIEVEDEDEVTINENLAVEFNNFKSVDVFIKALETIYKNACEEIEDTLLIDYRKYDRLSFITNLILKFSDAQLLLVNDRYIGFKHEKFKINGNKEFKNIHIDESYCQLYYAQINKYLSNMLLFLNLQREKHTLMSDSEMPLHPINIPSENESTKESPLTFFEYLVKKNGVSLLFKRFKPSKEDLSKYDIDYDDASKTITYNNYDAKKGSYLTTTLTFKDYLFKCLKIEINKSLRLIEGRFKASENESQARFFLNQILNELKNLEKHIDKDKSATFYSEIKNATNTLIKTINSIYEVFVRPKEIGDKEPKFFVLKGTKEQIKETAINLHDSLVLKGYLEKDCKKDFVKLFTGQQPLNKITWLKNKNELKLFINLLIQKEKIIKKGKKWIITAANFKFNDGEFTAKQINDIKLPTDESIINEFISKISH